MKLNVHSAVSRKVIVTSILIVLILGSVVIYLELNQTEKHRLSPLSSFDVEKLEILNPANGHSQTGLVYIASTPAQQAQGFQNETNFGNCNGLSVNSSTQCIGMIFVFSKSQNLCLWMHNTPLALQQVWISSNNTVVYIYLVQAETDKSVCHDGSKVLETSPDTLISLGDTILLQSLSS